MLNPKGPFAGGFRLTPSASKAPRIEEKQLDQGTHRLCRGESRCAGPRCHRSGIVYSLNFGAGVQADFREGLTLYVAYAGEWAGDRTVNSLTGGLRFRW